MTNRVLLGLTAMATAFAFIGVKAANADGATVKGKVFYKGEKIPRKVVKFDADPTCASLHSKKVGTENFLLNKEDNSLQNVIVYVKDGLEGKSFDPPDEKLTLDQHGCMYSPHVLTIQVDQTLVIKNSDPTTHNIHSQSTKNPQVNFGQPKQGMTREETFKFPEIFGVKCDVHPWMSSYIGVFDHPFHAVTGEDGTYEIKGLPAGKYTVVAWHEEFGDAAEMEITVTEDESKEADITIDKS